jgi:hypothetical protein
VSRKEQITAERASIEGFIAELREIAPRKEAPIHPGSDLTADLGFDSLAFAQLGVLLYERYRPDGAVVAANLRERDTATVESVFRTFILSGR